MTHQIDNAVRAVKSGASRTTNTSQAVFSKAAWKMCVAGKGPRTPNTTQIGNCNKNGKTPQINF